MGPNSPFNFINAMQKMATKSKDSHASASAPGLAHALRLFSKALRESWLQMR
jgi:hypothetical protein